MCLNCAYLILGLGDQYVGNWQKNTTHISSMDMNDVIVYMHTFFPWPCQILFDIYDNHAES